jgi:hypothetical protein
MTSFESVANWIRAPASPRFPTVGSNALRKWLSGGQATLDQIEAAHAAVGGKGPGRRHATLQINHAYVVLLASQFQAFARDLHTEAADVVVSHTQPGDAATLLGILLTQGRKLDQGNAGPSSLGADFGRLGMEFWKDVRAFGHRNARRQQQLDRLVMWRNAIAHQDYTRVGGDPKIGIAQVRAWRATCRALSKAMDTAVGTHLRVLVGTTPW